MAFTDHKQHVGDEKWRTVILWQDLDWKLVSCLMMAISNAKYYKVLDRVTVVMMIANNTCFNVIDSKCEALLTWIIMKQKQEIKCLPAKKLVFGLQND